MSPNNAAAVKGVPQPVLTQASSTSAAMTEQSQKVADRSTALSRRPSGYSELLRAMRRTCLFSKLDPASLQHVASSMDRINFTEGDKLGAPMGEPTTALYVITRGAVERRRAGYVVDESADGMGDLPAAEEPSWAPDAFGSVPTKAEIEARELARTETKSRVVEVTERVETVGEGSGLVAFGTLHVLEENRPSFATTVAVSDGVAWRLEATVLRDLFNNPDVARGLAAGLATEIFRMSERYRTPLLEQPPQVVNVAAVSVAAAFEAYYRAALNSFMNASLVGREAAGTALFPNMHVQIPTRVAYINGFKATRQWLQGVVTERWAVLESQGLKVPEMERYVLRFAPVLLPGVFMTPLSGILEASNAGQSNPEPMAKRMWRGLTPRCCREVIFGVGLNQLSEWCEERVPDTIAESKLMRNSLGSLTAGLAAGYFSHVPHNLSQLKLLQPHTSYWVHFQSLVGKASVPVGMPDYAGKYFAAASAVLAPKGLMIRSSQIVGSFVLLNGISHLLDVRLWGK